jgi:hypothetical protein
MMNCLCQDNDKKIVLLKLHCLGIIVHHLFPQQIKQVYFKFLKCISAYENEDRLLWDPDKLEDSVGKWSNTIHGHATRRQILLLSLLHK